MNENVGSIFYDARIDTASFNKDANKVESRASEVASSVERNGGRGFSNFASQAADSFSSVANGLGLILKSAVLLGTTGSVGIGAMTKASWDQVSAVQQATVALNAYEKDTGKVNKTLGDLVAYARSDLGVLFNRKDLFAAAQGLKIMGDNTEQLTDHVKIMSRSVGLGLSNWDDLTQVIGRIGSTGRLAGEDFDNLTKAGFKLDSSLRNTNISFDDLFKALDKGIPADAMAGQANTIVGMGVRLQTAFRGIGDAILGVDADSGQFIKGGLGDKLVGLMGTLRDVLKDPALKDGFKKMGRAIGDFSEKALPVLLDGFKWIVNNTDTIVAGVAALVVAFGAAKLAALGFTIAASANPVGLLAAAIVALVAGLAFLQVKFDIFGRALAFLKPVTDQVVGGFNMLYGIFQKYLLPILQVIGGFLLNQLREAWISFKAGIDQIVVALSPFISQTQLLQVLLIALVAPIVVTIATIGILIVVIAAIVVGITRLIGAIAQVYAWFVQLAVSVAQSMYQFSTSVAVGVGNVISWFASLPSRVLGAIGNIGSLLYNVGRDMINGLIRGIQDMIGSVQRTAGNIGQAVQDKFKSVLGIHSPSTVFATYGKNIVQGLSIGIDKNTGMANDSVGSMIGGLGSRGLSVSVASSSSLNSIDAAAAEKGGGSNVTVNLSMAGIMARSKSDERDIARNLVKRLNEELQAKGIESIGGGAI